MRLNHADMKKEIWPYETTGQGDVTYKRAGLKDDP